MGLVRSPEAGPLRKGPGAQCNEALAFQLSKITQAGRQVCRFVLGGTSASGLRKRATQATNAPT